MLVLFVLVDGLLFFRHQRLKSTTTEPEAVAVSPSTLAPKEEATTSGESTTPSTASKQGANGTPTEGTTSPTTGESDVLRVTLAVVDAPSWLTVREDGLLVLSELVDPGFSQEFDADREVSVDAGNGGAVQATVDGQDAGRLAPTPEVTSRTFTR